MGCLNSDQRFTHWFGNIHLSGACNRSCYFCIGQHMMELDRFDNLDTWPLQGLGEFIDSCVEHRIDEINVTGTNTDPSLYRHMEELRDYLDGQFSLGIRTNGVALPVSFFRIVDRISVSCTSLDPELYRRTMGSGKPPDIRTIRHLCDRHGVDLKINIVLCPETVESGDIFRTLEWLEKHGIKRVNLREPYGQPHVGKLFQANGNSGKKYGMPVLNLVSGMQVVYWDVHYVEVESVNLYANGRVSVTYPITKGYSESGIVLSQEHWQKSGRQFEQWLEVTR